MIRALATGNYRGMDDRDKIYFYALIAVTFICAASAIVAIEGPRSKAFDLLREFGSLIGACLGVAGAFGAVMLSFYIQEKRELNKLSIKYSNDIFKYRVTLHYMARHAKKERDNQREINFSDIKHTTKEFFSTFIDVDFSTFGLDAYNSFARIQTGISIIQNFCNDENYKLTSQYDIHIYINIVDDCLKEFDFLVNIIANKCSDIKLKNSIIYRLNNRRWLPGND